MHGNVQHASVVKENWYIQEYGKLGFNSIPALNCEKLSFLLSLVETFSPLCSFKLEPKWGMIILLSGKMSRPFSYHGQ